MINIVILHEGEMPTMQDIYNSFQYLVKHYKVSLVKKNIIYFSLNDLPKIDVLLCVRVHSPLSYGIMKEAVRKKKKVIYVLDDDLKDLPKGFFWFPIRKRWLLKCLKLSEILMTSNKLIGEEYQELIGGNRIVLINTSVNPLLFCKPREVENSIRIVIAASEGHTQTVEEYISPIIPKLARKYHEKIEWFFVGLKPSVNNKEKDINIHYVPPMSLKNYTKYMRSNKFDLGIGVLKPNHFTERKYYNKYIEYTKYGICGLYSKCMPFQLVVQNGINGILVENTIESWYSALCWAIDNPKERKQYILNAQEHLKTKYNEEYLFQKLIHDCPELVSYKSSDRTKASVFRWSLWKIYHFGFRIIESLYLTIFSLSYYGIQKTSVKIKRKIQQNYNK